MDRQQEGVPRLWYLDEGQERDLLDYLDRLKDTELLHITGFLLHTGARWGDLQRLKFKDWNEKDNTICFGKLKQGGLAHYPGNGPRPDGTGLGQGGIPEDASRQGPARRRPRLRRALRHGARPVPVGAEGPRDF